MFDWLYAIPLAILILGSGITYFMSSSLFGPFCILVSIVVSIMVWKARSTRKFNKIIDKAVKELTEQIDKDILDDLTKYDTEKL